MSQVLSPERPASPRAGAHVVELNSVIHRYNQVAAVDDVSITVDEGSLVTLLGPSGSGKTTVLNLVAGAFAPTSGRICINGDDVTQLPANKRNIGMVFQSYTLFPSKNVADNIAFPLTIRRVPRTQIQQRVGEAMRLVHMEALADHYPMQLSGGQAQRVALARALVFRPSIMLFDEPLGALDRALRTELQQEIRRIQQGAKIAALYVTHDQEEALSISDKIVLFRDGKVVQQGSPREVYDNPRTVWAANFLGDANVIPIDSADRAGKHVVVSSGGAKLAFETESDEWRDAAVVIARPEDSTVTVQPASDAALHGRIEDVEYRGATQRLTVKLTDGPRIVATTSGHETQLHAGVECFVSWRPDSVTFVRD